MAASAFFFYAYFSLFNKSYFNKPIWNYKLHYEFTFSFKPAVDKIDTKIDVADLIWFEVFLIWAKKNCLWIIVCLEKEKNISYKI